MSLALADALAARSGTYPGLPTLTHVIRERARSGDWALTDVRWAPHTGTLLAFQNEWGVRGFEGVRVDPAEVTEFDWRDDPELADGINAVLRHWGPGAQPLRYEPLRHAVLRTVDPTGTATITVVYPASDFDAVAGFYQGLAPVDPLPRVVAINLPWRSVTFAEVDGTTAADAARVNVVERQAILRSVGQAIATLHRQPAPTRLAADRQQVLDARRTDVRAINVWDHTLADRMAGMLDRLAGDTAARPTVFIHGALSFGTVMLTPTGPRFINLDAAGAGEPARDLGAASAQLIWQGLVNDEPGVWSAARQALTDAYAHAGSALDPDDVAWWTQAAALELIAGRYRQLDFDTWPLVDPLLDQL